MTSEQPYQPVAYDDADTSAQMYADCAACVRTMEGARLRLGDVTAGAPVLTYAPREARKPTITVSDATAHLASRLHLHLHLH